MFKKFAAGCLALLLPMTMMGCSSNSAASDTQSGSDASASGDGYSISMLLKTTAAEYWQYVIAGANAYTKEHPEVKVDISGPPSATSYDEWMNSLTTMLGNDDIDAFILSPLQSDSAAHQISGETRPIITVDTDIDAPEVLSFVGTGNLEAATSGAEEAAKKAAQDASDVKDSIPADYSQMSAAVSQLKEATAKLKDGKISKFYASSQGNTNLPDSDDGRIMDLTLYGKSEQKQYAGYQLLPNNTEFSVIGNTTYTWKNVNLISGKTYILKNNIQSKTSGSFILYGVDKDATRTQIAINTVSKLSSGLSFVAKDNYFEILIYFNQASNEEEMKLMLEEGSTAHDFEPYVGGIPSPNPEYPQEIKSVVNPVVTISDGADKQQTATLPYTLNAIPVSSGGNITIDGQQYIADYVDVERGKLVRMVKAKQLSGSIEMSPSAGGLGWVDIAIDNCDTSLNYLLADSYTFIRGSDDAWNSTTPCVSYSSIVSGTTSVRFYDTASTSVSTNVMYPLATPTETDLTADEIAAFKPLVGHYPVTNVSVTSDQLDGYTVFDYPISLANGWNYVKQQLGDTRDYLYGIDLMTAEAYVNSEYAAALAEIEV